MKKVEINNRYRMPERFSEHAEDIMSNFDGAMVEEVADEIKGKDIYAGYAGWNFRGKVWWEHNKWLCEVWVHGSWLETFISDSPQGLMEEVSSKYGWD